MNNKNENTILQIIKYTPPIFIVTLSIIISVTLYLNNQAAFNEDKIKIEHEHIQNNKELVKKEVENVYEYILTQQNDTEKKLKESLKERVYEAYKIAMNIYEENKHLEKSVVQKMIKDAIRTIRFNNKRGYFFIYSFDYECILLPIAKHIEGKNFYNFKDGKGKYLTRDIISQVKKEKEGFMQWWYHKPSDMKNQYKKLGFNKHFEPYDWFIGTGEYIDDFENDIKKDVLEHISKLKYTKDGYIFVLDYKANYLNHARKELLGQNALKVQDTRNTQTVLDTIEIAKKGSGYITYEQIRKPGSNLPVIKTSYIKGIQKWEWFIGKGFYEDETNEIIKEKKKILDLRLNHDLNNLIISSTILTLILLFISIYISKLLEKRFKLYQDEIKANLNEITKQHNMLAQQSKMVALGNMIGNIAHQWRQPLSMISTAATGMKLKKEMNILEDNEFNESLEHINNSAQYLSKTIDDFRNFFSKNKAKHDFSIKETIDSSINIVEAQFQNYNIEIFNKAKNSLIYGLKSELIQVIINILNNSKDELIKKEDNLRRVILIESFEKDRFVYITIKDNAGGIPENIIEHIFEPYFTTKHQSQGTGIGLYMCEEIISKHMHGKISIENSKFNFEDEEYFGASITIKLKLS